MKLIAERVPNCHKREALKFSPLNADLTSVESGVPPKAPVNTGVTIRRLWPIPKAF